MSAPRWSGYDSQSKPWRDGYDWARDEGLHSHLDAFGATKEAGYDFDSLESAQWDLGATFAQNEIAGDRE